MVKELDVAASAAFLEQRDVDYYTMCGRDKSTEILAVDRSKEFFGHKLFTGQLKVITRVTGFIKKHERTGEVVGGGKLELPERVLETTGMWVLVNNQTAKAIKEYSLSLMGGLHALEHAAIGLLPLFAMCDGN